MLEIMCVGLRMPLLPGPSREQTQLNRLAQVPADGRQNFRCAHAPGERPNHRRADRRGGLSLDHGPVHFSGCWTGYLWRVIVYSLPHFPKWHRFVATRLGSSSTNVILGIATARSFDSH